VPDDRDGFHLPEEHLPMKRARLLIESDGWLWFLAVAGTLFRLALILWVGRTSHFGENFADEMDYDAIGNSIAHGYGFWVAGHPTAYRPPGQPVLIGLIFALLGHHAVYVQIVEAFLLAALPFLCSRLGRAIGLSLLAANVAAALAAFHPALAYACTTTYPTVLTAFAVTLGVWLCWESMRRQGVGTAVMAGVALGVAGAATTTFAPLAILAGLVMAARRHFKIAVIVAVVGTVPAIAWMVRNDLVLGAFTLATNGGQNLALGARDDASPRSGNWVEVRPGPKALANGEVGIDLAFRARAESWIRAHPARYAELVALRAVLVVDSAGNPKTSGLHSGKLEVLVAYLLLPAVILGIVGLYFNRRQPIAWLTMCALALVIFSSALTIVKPRFRFPCDPLLSIFAVSGAVELRDQFWKRKNSELRGAVA
jgi:4-amino-4-deoxy-L-arabinose transferase-like glycosyltransferase